MENKAIMILGEDNTYSLNCYDTKLNNNVLVIGTSGSGKTRSVVTPNLLQATGSYIITDPKGNLYQQYGKYLREMGYDVKLLDFKNPEKSTVHYNPFHFVHSTDDIGYMAHTMVYAEGSSLPDPFWDQSAEILLQSVIAYLNEGFPERERTICNVIKLLSNCEPQSKNAFSEPSSPMDALMEEHRKKHPNSYAVEMYDMFRAGAQKTIQSIIISTFAKLGRFNTDGLKELMKTNDLNLTKIGHRKTALFVAVSDTDRSKDGLVNIFFTQALNELVREADTRCHSYSLPVPVRFIMDDFATNCRIADFEKSIASIRSRNISAMLLVQSERQLYAGYGEDGATIIANCDTIMYLGGNDLESAKSMAERCNQPVRKIMYMPVGTNWVCRRGSEPYNGRNLNLEDYLERSGYAVRRAR